MIGDEAHEAVYVEALLGGGHDDVVEVAQRLSGLQLGVHLLGVRDIRLGDDEQLVVGVGLGHVLGDPLVARADRLGGVDEKRDDVGIGKLAQGGAVELAPEGVLRFVQARRVDDDQLRGRRVDDGAHATARGLGNGTRDGDLLAHAGIEER